MYILNSILSWVIKKRIHQIELFIKYPHDVQHEWLSKLIASAKNTEFGKEYDFANISNYETFRRRVPVFNYEKLQPRIERMMRGEENILWPTEIKWFAKSSGTTSNKSKYIPMSQESMEECHFKAGKDMLSIYCNNYPESKIFTGKGLTLGGTYEINDQSSNVLTSSGDLSAIIMQNLPLWVEVIRTPELSVALMGEWEEKMDKIARFTSEENVTNLSGVPSWMLVLLQHVIKINQVNNLLEVWPNLELFIHGGVSFKPYKEQFKNIIPSDQMNYLETYNASEGFFGIQDQKNSDELLLMLDYGVFYEFIPMDEIENEHPKVLNLSEVEQGKNYALLITTNGGLWRYMIGDTISFTSLNPFRFHITGRTKHFINTFGEELIIDNAERALKQACERSGAVIKEYTAGPKYMDEGQTGAHEWLIEFEQLPENLEYFKEELDKNLKILNSDYEAKRYKNMTLGPPIVRPMPEGTFYHWLKQKGKLGGQHKVPRLANHRDYLEEVLQLCKQSAII